MPTRSRRLAPLSVVLLAAVTVLATLGVSGLIRGDTDPGVATASSASASGPAARPAGPASTTTDVTDVVRRVSPAVALVRAGDGEGTGFLIDRDGRLLTNAHVVANDKTVQVRFGEGKAIEGTVLGKDASSDVAVVQVDASKVHAGPLTARTDTPQVGEATIAIGSPFGLSGTVTTGIVSATGRDIQAPDGFTIPGAVQTDAAINPGNSGGPLLDAQGRVIGINSQIATNGSRSSSGVGFAVPIATARKVATAIDAGKTVQHAWLGVATADAAGSASGATVGEVVSGSPADRAAIKPGDVITRVGDTEVADSSAMAGAVAAHQPGDTLKLTLRRDGAEHQVEVALAQRPSQVAR